MLSKIQTFRRDLHQIPEVGFDLTKTSAYVEQALKEMGYSTYRYASTGIVGFRQGQKQGSIAFRADMDALPITEKTNLPFASTHPGKMHACGHDGHMAMLLGFADYMKDKPLPNESLLLVFQPAEEGPGGAKPMIEEGLLQRFQVSNIFGLHLWPTLEQGIIGLKEVAMMARNGEVIITIHGQSSHGAEPHKGKDSIYVAAILVEQIQSIIARDVAPLSSAVLTIGTIQGGNAANILAETVQMKGTIRAFEDDVYASITKRLMQITKGLEIAYQVTIQCQVKDFYPVVFNDSTLFNQVRSALVSDEYTLVETLSVSEDFAFYQQQIPGIFALLGTKNKEKGYIYPLHNSQFNFDDTVLQKGVDYFVRVAKALKLIP